MAAAAFSSPAAAAEASCPHAAARAASLTTGTARRTLLCLVNRVRRSHGLPRVRAERHLRRAATGHSDDMARRHYFAHDRAGGPPLASRVQATGYLDGVHAWFLGEALAWGSGTAAEPGQIMTALLNSPPHRAILLDPTYRDLGIGLTHAAPDGAGPDAMMVTLDFGRLQG
ncbi:CAP domain-containing protein [Baekduia soli]|uniref:CAP domain-containing protein n=1 Tax=Baekduia soli TaxID=496014 RepID=UPI001651BB73|nr:CAP domain-containing protein [Baekduia soli]